MSNELFEANPTQVAFKFGLATSHRALGDVLIKSGDFDQVIHHYSEYLRLSQELHEDSPLEVNYKWSFAEALVYFGEFYKQVRPDKSKAWKYYCQAEDIYLELVEQSPNDTGFRHNLQSVERELDELAQK